MAPCANRRFLCLLTALLFVVSNAAHVYAITGMTMKTSSAAMKMAATGDDMDGGGDCDKSKKIDCMAMCATSVAIVTDPITVPTAVGFNMVESALDLPLAESSPYPEPHPPRTGS